MTRLFLVPRREDFYAFSIFYFVIEWNHFPFGFRARGTVSDF